MSETKAAARIESLDAIRGFAVLGILIVNAPFFAAPWQAALNPTLPPLAVTDRTLWSWALPHVLFEYKCITLFSMLFGASLYLVGGEWDDRARGAVLLRRLAWLAVFGAIHGALIWYGDILFFYALAGFAVMGLRSLRATALMALGAGLVAGETLLAWSMAGALRLVSAEAAAQAIADAWAPIAAERARVAAAFTGDLVAVTVENARTWVHFVAGGWLLVVMRAAGAMLMGLALFKWGVLSGRAPGWLYGALIAAGALALGGVAWQAARNAELGFEAMHMLIDGARANALLSPLAALAYASALILLLRAGALRPFTAALGAVGRMAFTNYVAQSLLMTGLFWGGRGLGLFGKLDRPALLGVVAVIWALMLIWSPLWLRHFRMGPLEWLWRRLSAGADLPIRAISSRAPPR